MKYILLSLIAFTSICFAIEQKHLKKEVIPASHEYRLSEKEVKEACIAYIKSKGIKVPDGSISISGLDSKHFYMTYDKSGSAAYEKGITVEITEYDSKDE